MSQFLATLRSKRLSLLNLTEKLNVARYNKVPTGYNNNVIWNLGHVILVADKRLYRESGLELPARIPELLPFGKGTKPVEIYGEAAIADIRKLLWSSIDEFESSIPGEKKLRKELSIDPNAMEFILFHEGYHFFRVSELISALN